MSTCNSQLMSGGRGPQCGTMQKTRTPRRRVFSRLGSGLGLALAVGLGLRPCPDPNIRFVAREDSTLPRPVGTSPRSHPRHDSSFRCFPHKQSKPIDAHTTRRSIADTRVACINCCLIAC